ncbi:MAG: mandelate racemase/muconate lactonizing enzyme family protein [Planctomycetes bacterium]|nr:mandelate racemase/muconate lactonizing enzyme family protein [Planctomycetota bacterium]
MRIESVDIFYLRMPEVLDIGDGSQDATLVRVSGGGHVGWGQCEASPLASIAAWVCPLSHSACKPVSASVLGRALDSVEDIVRIGDEVRANSLDLLQAEHMLSGVDIALWDLLGRAKGEPVWRLLGYRQAHPKLPYASVLFGDTPQETLEKAKRSRAAGFRAGKFGWGPYGKGSAAADRDQVMAAREGLGPDGVLLVDAGTIWNEDVARASERVAALREARTTWLEEPFHTGALGAYGELAKRCAPVKLAGGEGSHNFHMAQHLIDHGGIGYVQIDTGRIGGITPAKRVADYAHAKGVTYVNHTFTSQLSLCASLQPYVGIAGDEICEYPTESKAVSARLTKERLLPGADGLIRVPDTPGLGMTPDPAVIREFLVDAEIRVAGKTLYRTPSI